MPHIVSNAAVTKTSFLNLSLAQIVEESAQILKCDKVFLSTLTEIKESFESSHLKDEKAENLKELRYLLIRS